MSCTVLSTDVPIDVNQEVKKDITAETPPVAETSVISTVKQPPDTRPAPPVITQSSTVAATTDPPKLSKFQAYKAKLFGNSANAVDSQGIFF